MKEKLLQFEDLHLLKRNEKLVPECCYILNSESVAQNTYFETKRDIEWAHKMIKRHLIHVMDIIDYLFTPDGWMLVVTVKSEEEILSEMVGSRYTSKKMKDAIKKKEISIILSELMRYCISGIARITNRYNKRGGALVRSNFNRLIFGSLELAERVMKKMKQEQISLCHKKKRYRARMKWYDVAGELMGNGAIFLRSGRKGNAEFIGFDGDCLLSIITKSTPVLREKIKYSLQIYSTQIAPLPPLFFNT